MESYPKAIHIFPDSGVRICYPKNSGECECLFIIERSEIRKKQRDFKSSTSSAKLFFFYMKWKKSWLKSTLKSAFFRYDGLLSYLNLILKTKSTVADDQIKSRRALERKETHVLDFFDLHLTFPTDPNRVAKQSFNKSDKDTKSPKQMHRSWKPPQKKTTEKRSLSTAPSSLFLCSHVARYVEARYITESLLKNENLWFFDKIMHTLVCICFTLGWIWTTFQFV